MARARRPLAIPPPSPRRSPRCWPSPQHSPPWGHPAAPRSPGAMTGSASERGWNRSTAPSSLAGEILDRTRSMGREKESAWRCLLCGSELVPVLAEVHDTRFGLPGAYGIHGCRRCGLEHTLPRPSQSELNRFYEEHYNFAEVTGASYHGLRRLLHSPLFYRLWLAIDGDVSLHTRRGLGRLLDVGCNEGRGLAFYRANGFQAEGLELNSVAAAAARAQGFTVHEQPLESFQPPEPYDVIVM